MVDVSMVFIVRVKGVTIGHNVMVEMREREMRGRERGRGRGERERGKGGERNEVDKCHISIGTKNEWLTLNQLLKLWEMFISK